MHVPANLVLWLSLVLPTVTRAQAHTLATAAPPRPTCTVVHTDIPGADDSPSIREAIANCSTNATILFESGAEYNAFTPVMFALGQDVTIELLGNISLPDNITTVQTGVSSKLYRSGWFSFTSTGPGVALVGPTSGTGGIIQSYGQAWWDAGQQTNRPLLFAWRVNNGSISHVTISKPIGKSFNIAGNGNIIQNVVIDAKSVTASFPFNTDGFDVGGDGNTIRDSQVSNGDDCVAIGSPCSNLHVKGLTCTGSHGISVAAKGGGQVSVSNILVEDILFVDSLYAVRYKSTAGNIGIAKNIVYRNIGVKNVTFPIYVTQNYYDQSQAPPPPSNTSVTIDGLSVSNVAGTINSRSPGDGSCISNPCWYHVPNADGTQAIIFDSFYPGTAKEISVANVFVVPDLPWKLPTVLCNASTTPLDIGFKCWDGVYIPTLLA
ncbi:Glycoside hydrolase family 28 protein [Mycena indigotica]|uniref:galacturonan 1,4-alpha-galacturonidase n=1 Tax=Mycena indigotica TaxID=2126181 RepID=A0A8H6TG33_9AGAR|nr:Glycoside hydrolase family 28 protein [Mycena indigotica]KAF7316077.1 Glycoside hydrolase family 28 protein [Mycena indigotica]